jgi:hypothetical protein
MKFSTRYNSRSLIVLGEVYVEGTRGEQKKKGDIDQTVE